MILAAEYWPAVHGDNPLRVYIATRAAKCWRIHLSWQHDDGERELIVRTLDKLPLRDAIKTAQDELLRQFPEDAYLNDAHFTVWCDS